MKRTLLLLIVGTLMVFTSIGQQTSKYEFDNRIKTIQDGHALFLKNFLNDQPIPWFMKEIPYPNYTEPPRERKLTQQEVDSMDIKSSPKVDAPVITKIIQNGIFGVFAEYTHPDFSNIDYIVCAVGSTPGGADLSWWTILSSWKRKTYCENKWTLNVPEGSTIYISVRASKTGVYSTTTTSGPIVLNYAQLGNDTNNVRIKFANYTINSGNLVPGSSLTDSVTINTNLRKFFYGVPGKPGMLAIIKQLYGPPAHSYDVTLVNNTSMTGSNVFYCGLDEIHTYIPTTIDINYRLLTHEVIHAWRDDNCLASSASWVYSTKMSAFEECAEGVAFSCMNMYRELYRTDNEMLGFLGSQAKYYGSDFEWEMDYMNTPEMACTDLWSDMSGSGIYYFRYGTLAGYINKFYAEDSSFYRNFNIEYYRRINANHNYNNVIRDSIISIFVTVKDTIEYTPTRDWLNDKYVFSANNTYGYKVWTNLQHYPYWNGYMIYNRFVYYNTFDPSVIKLWGTSNPISNTNGSEWAYFDNNHPHNKSGWVYYWLNNKSGTFTLKDYSGNVINTLPIANNVPYTTNIWENGGGGISYQRLTLVNNGYNPGGGGIILNNISTFGLYKMEITFQNNDGPTPYYEAGTATRATHTCYRVQGSEFVQSNTFKGGVFGGILNTTGSGEICFHHRSMGGPLGNDTNHTTLRNGAFHKLTSWTEIPHSNNNYKYMYNVSYGKYSEPGIFTIMYTDNNGDKYLGYKTNGPGCSFGSIDGSQLFLFDKTKMVKFEVGLSPSYNVNGTFLDLAANYYPDASYEWKFNSSVVSTTRNIHITVPGVYTIKISLPCGYVSLNITVTFNGIGIDEYKMDDLYKKMELCELVSLDVFNVLGQQLFSKTENGKEASLFLHKLISNQIYLNNTSNIYIYRVNFNDGSAPLTGKFLSN
jgi:hypothetical protein